MLRTTLPLLLLACAPRSRVHVEPVLVEARSAPARELAELVAFVQTAHPDPYRLVSREAFEDVSAAAIRRLDAVEGPDAFAIERAYRRVLALLGDFHTQVGLDLYQPGAQEPLSLLPVHVQWVGDRAVVDAATVELPEGAWLTHVNGHPVEQVRRQATELVLADGASLQARHHAIDDNLARYYHLLHGMEPSYTLSVRTPAGGQLQHEVPGATREAFGAMTRRRRSRQILGDPAGPPWPRLHHLPDGTPVLRLASFGNPDQRAYHARVDALFEQIGRPRALVLDVRGNPGGFRTHGLAVLEHLSPEPTPQWSAFSVRTRTVPARWRDQVRTPWGPVEGLAERFPETRGTGPARVVGEPLLPGMQPRADALVDTRLIVLADAGTNSAANELVLALKAARPDTLLVGQELGGACDVHVGEFPVVYRAPASGVTVLMSLIRIEHVPVPSCRPDRGLLPDHPVDWTTEALVAGRDPWLERAGELVGD